VGCFVSQIYPQTKIYRRGKKRYWTVACLQVGGTRLTCFAHESDEEVTASLDPHGADVPTRCVVRPQTATLLPPNVLTYCRSTDLEARRQNDGSSSDSLLRQLIDGPHDGDHRFEPRSLLQLFSSQRLKRAGGLQAAI